MSISRGISRHTTHIRARREKLTIEENAASRASDHAIVLSHVQRDMEERQCRVNGRLGMVEKVYQRRGQQPGVFGAKVIMDDGPVIYCDVLDVSVF